PASQAAVGEIGDELTRVRTTPPERVQKEIGACLEHVRNIEPSVERQLRASDASALLADLLHALWKIVVEPAWPQLRDLLEGDVHSRSRLLARGGLASLFADLEPLVTLRERTLYVDLMAEGTCVLGGRGLELIPSAFIWPHALVGDTPPTLIYPSRGV